MYNKNGEKAKSNGKVVKHSPNNLNEQLNNNNTHMYFVIIKVRTAFSVVENTPIFCCRD